MDQPQSFSFGSDNVLKALHPHQRSATAFPLGLTVDGVKWRSGETLDQWFRRLIDKYCKGDPTQLAMEENIAILAVMSWKNRLITGASVTALVVADCTLAEFYGSGKATDAIYVRLDMAYDPLGEMFSHPLAHVHIGNGDTPRFALQGDGDGNVLMDFLEFVYRNFAYDKWRLWAGRKWSKTYPTRVAEFDQIARYFAVSDFMGLRQDAKIITDIKKVLRRARQDSFDCKAQPTDLALMQYP